jgi:teichuronic acid biosynthesis glycosyltransferase TuaH
MSRGRRSCALPGDWTNLVVFFAGTAWDGNRFPDQHIAERLARDTPVLYVDPPLSLYSGSSGSQLRQLRYRSRLQLVNDGLARFTPLTLPPQSRGPMVPLTTLLVRSQARRVSRELCGGVRCAVVANMRAVFGACRESRQVLYATDDFSAGAKLMGISERSLRRLERETVDRADTVIAISDHLAETLRRRGARNVVVVENGVDYELFAGTDQAPLPADVVLPPPIAGFIGHLTDRIDLQMLEATAATGHSLLLVGPPSSVFDMGRLKQILDRPNVQWVGRKPFESLPSYLRLIDVGLLPYADTEFNRSSFPLKVLEYLAAGRPAVVTDLPAVRSLGEAVRIAPTPHDFATAVSELLAAPKDAAAMARRRAIAAEHSWDAAAQQFANAIGLT